MGELDVELSSLNDWLYSCFVFTSSLLHLLPYISSLYPWILYMVCFIWAFTLSFLPGCICLQGPLLRQYYFWFTVAPNFSSNGKNPYLHEANISEMVKLGRRIFRVEMMNKFRTCSIWDTYRNIQVKVSGRQLGIWIQVLKQSLVWRSVMGSINVMKYLEHGSGWI